MSIEEEDRTDGAPGRDITVRVAPADGHAIVSINGRIRVVGEGDELVMRMRVIPIEGDEEAGEEAILLEQEEPETAAGEN